MDFFERQDKARRNTKWLVFYFIAAVVLIVASVYLALLFIFHSASNFQHGSQPPVFALWNPKLFLLAASGTLAIITCGSLFKTAQLSSGGSAVAESLGGRLLNTNTNDPAERKLLNVVEEMAIASGVPMPQVYVMDDEQGINAFAAGHTLNDAVIGVTRGCITTLKRDELQGVIGHEFSHILNGDMRLNLRLMGIIFGILCLAVIGRILLHSRGSSRGKNPLPIIGLVLILFGWIGVLFGRLIQSAVSRQREFLADASAVQFTRNPAGLSGALQKIGALAQGSQMQSEHAAEASHLFFGNPMTSSLFNVFATHPPLEERIRAIDPGWDGKFPDVLKATLEESESVVGEPKKPRSAFPPIIPGFPAGVAGLASAASVSTESILPSLGNPTPQHLRYAVELRDSLPENIRAAAHHPQQACALLFSMLLSDDSNLRASQLEQLAQRTSSEISNQAAALWPEVSTIRRRARLPVVNLALPALDRLTADEFRRFNEALTWLIRSDRRIVLFEFVLQKIIQRQVEARFANQKPTAIQFYSIRPLVPDCAVLLSALAHSSHPDPTEVAKAFQTGVPYLRTGDVALRMLPSDQSGLADVSKSLDRLALATPQIKKNLLDACAHVVGADGLIHENEAELLRGIAETLDCPMPPFIPPTT
ncbi:MAG TPA: M48 family metallopeptidase [Verrucomicrobiae bacterium]|nr:M48 family metallopeptidase [Verrucomicrobiae bacterium]